MVKILGIESNGIDLAGMISAAASRVTGNVWDLVRTMGALPPAALLIVAQWDKIAVSLESIYILIKTDLDLPGACHQAKSSLLVNLRNEAIFSPEFTHYFSDGSLDNMENNPKQVVSIKKIVKALDDLEQCLENLDDLASLYDIDKDDMDEGEHDRNTMLLSIKLFYTLGLSLNVAMDALNAANQNAVGIEALIGDTMTPLVSKMNRLLASVSASDLGAERQQWLPAAMALLQPDQSSSENPGLKKLSQLIVLLPQYLQMLQTWIDPNSTSEAVKDAPEKQQKKIDAFLKNFVQLSSSTSAPFLGMVSVTKLLMDHLPTVINAAGPLSETVHLKTEDVLNQLKHVHFPEMLAQLESLEEHLSLRRHLLVEPALKAMNDLYNTIYALPDTLEDTSGHLNTVAEGLSTRPVKIMRSLLGNGEAISINKIDRSTGLREMCDDVFIERLVSLRINRFSDAHALSMDESVLKAADTFFHAALLCAIPHLKFFPARAVDQIAVLKNVMSQLTDIELNGLKEKYKIIQPYYATLYPRMDVLFVMDPISWLKKNASLLQTDTMKLAVKALIQQEKSQYKQTCDYIQTSNDDRERLYRSNRRELDATPMASSPRDSTSPETVCSDSGSKSVASGELPLLSPIEIHDRAFSFSSRSSSLLGSETDASVPLIFDEWVEKINSRVKDENEARQRLTGSLEALGNQPRYMPLMDRMFSLHISARLKQFINHELKNWAEKNLDDDIYQQLIFDQSRIRESVVRDGEVLVYENTPTVMLYRKLLFVLDVLQKNVETLERAYETMLSKQEADPLFPMYRLDFLMLLSRIDIGYLACFISDIKQAPQLSDIMRQALVCLAPLEKVPVLGDYIQSMHVSHTNETAPPFDIVARWEYEKMLVQYTLKGYRVPPFKQPVGTEEEGEEEETKGDEALERNALQASDTVSLTPFPRMIAEKLHDLSDFLHKMNPDMQDKPGRDLHPLDQKIDALLHQVNLYNRETLSLIFSLISELTNVVTSIHVEATETAIVALKRTCGQLGLELISLADEAEFQLFFQPGTLSNPLNDAFYDFCLDLIECLPISREDKNQWAGELSLTEQRIERGRLRLQEVEKSSRIEEENLFHTFSDQYRALAEMRRGDLNDVKPDFKTRDEQVRLLHIYQQLQPYLYPINPMYNQTSFLRQLKTPSDFRHLYDEIEMMSGQLSGLLEQEEKNNLEMKNKRTAHIDILVKNEETQKNRTHSAERFRVHIQLALAFRKADDDFQKELYLITRTQSTGMGLDRRSDLTFGHFCTKRITGLGAEAREQIIGHNAPNPSQIQDEIMSGLASMIASWNVTYANRMYDKLELTGYSQHLNDSIQEDIRKLYSLYWDWLKQCVALQKEESKIPTDPSRINDTRRHDLQQIKMRLLDNDLSPQERVTGGMLDCYTHLVTLYEQLDKMKSSQSADSQRYVKIDNMQVILLNRDLTMEKRLTILIEYSSNTDTRNILMRNILMKSPIPFFLERTTRFNQEAIAFYHDVDTLKTILHTTRDSITPPPPSSSSPSLETLKGAMDDIRQQVPNEESSVKKEPHRKT
ncbi:MAG TPA: hypothetical protein DDY37_03695 [Legionella sp.]|nr:hypothetical protein [Legionella sp.]